MDLSELSKQIAKAELRDYQQRLWHPISEETYEDLRDFIAPLQEDEAGFVQAEPYTITPEGTPIYLTTTIIDGKHYCRFSTIAEWQHQREEILAAIEIQY